ncbi:MAG: hypothetical protein U9R51_03165 [Actinomycetota bacterium]|nr:hypothetical protein [Actinomycetota bacterium]
MSRQRWIWLGVAIAIVIAIGASFALGRSTAGESDHEVPVTTTASTIPEHGDAASRDAYIAAVRGSLPSNTPATDDEILATGDSLCANLAGFSNQDRDAHYAIRILWTDELRYLDSEEVAMFGVILAAAPEHLCPPYRALAEDIAYWLGI